LKVAGKDGLVDEEEFTKAFNAKSLAQVGPTPADIIEACDAD